MALDTMKHLNRHTFSWLLAWSSVGLLVAFQVFWLNKSFEEQAELIRKQTDNLFQQTVRQMQDSLFDQMIAKPIRELKPNQISSINIQMPPRRTRKSVVPTSSPSAEVKPAQALGNIRLDTSVRVGIMFRPDTNIRLVRRLGDSSRISIRMGNLPPGKLNELINVVKVSQRAAGAIVLKDSIPSRTNVPKYDSAYAKTYARVIAFKAKPPKDSLPLGPAKAMTSIVLTVQQQDGSQPITFQLKSDSLRTADITRRYASALANTQIALPFVVQRTRLAKPSVSSGFLTSSVACNEPPQQYYVASFSHYRWFVFQKIIPQVLFSALLIGLTVLAFGLVLRNVQQQQRLAILKNDFISNVTHELKTPIATVGVAIEALRSFDAIKDPTRTQEYLDISRNELSRLSMLVDKVLKMSMFEEKELDIKPEPVHLQLLTQEILASMKLQFEKHRATVRFETLGERFTLTADRTHLTSVVYNLLDNALKYGSERPEIDLKIESVGDTLWLSVQDNGPGIEPVYQQRIFEKFFRVPQGDRHNVKGHGLGLSYVASVVAQHGGVISLKSTVGQGSCFVVMLPLASND